MTSSTPREIAALRRVARNNFEAASPSDQATLSVLADELVAGKWVRVAPPAQAEGEQ